jgi:hypothetical protein
MSGLANEMSAMAADLGPSAFIEILQTSLSNTLRITTAQVLALPTAEAVLERLETEMLACPAPVKDWSYEIKPQGRGHSMSGGESFLALIPKTVRNIQCACMRQIVYAAATAGIVLCVLYGTVEFLRVPDGSEVRIEASTRLATFGPLSAVQTEPQPEEAVENSPQPQLYAAPAADTRTTDRLRPKRAKRAVVSRPVAHRKFSMPRFIAELPEPILLLPDTSAVNAGLSERRFAFHLTPVLSAAAVPPQSTTGIRRFLRAVGWPFKRMVQGISD